MRCPPCKGTGRAWGYQEKLCELCHGDGVLPDTRIVQPLCRPCQGTGRKWSYLEQLCEKCVGWGLLPPPEPEPTRPRFDWSGVWIATSVLVALGVLGVACVYYLLGRAGLWETWLVIGGVLAVPAGVVPLIGWVTGKLTLGEMWRALAKRS